MELRVARRTNEDYVSPTAGPIPAFSGSGNRLGAPIPPISGTDHPMPGRFDERVRLSEPQRLATRFEVDPSQPTTSIQLRLADGTRCVPSPLGNAAPIDCVINKDGMQDEPLTHGW